MPDVTVYYGTHLAFIFSHIYSYWEVYQNRSLSTTFDIQNIPFNLKGYNCSCQMIAPNTQSVCIVKMFVQFQCRFPHVVKCRLGLKINEMSSTLWYIASLS